MIELCGGDRGSWGSVGMLVRYHIVCLGLASEGLHSASLFTCTCIPPLTLPLAAFILSPPPPPPHLIFHLVFDPDLNRRVPMDFLNG